MNLEKLKPWNWFKHEESQSSAAGQIPVRREANDPAMPVMTGNVAHPMAQIHNEIDRLFDLVFRGFGLPSLGSRFFEPDSWLNGNDYRPSLNVSSDDSGYEITLEAPGMSEQDLDIELREDLLVVTGNKQEEKEEKDKHFYRVERHYGTFQRVLSLPRDAQTDAIEARLKNGVLSIRVPRSGEVVGNGKRIPIKH